MLLIIMLGQPSESWDYPRQSRVYCQPTNNTIEWGKSAQAQEAKEAQQLLHQKIKIYLLLDVVQMDLQPWGGLLLTFAFLWKLRENVGDGQWHGHSAYCPSVALGTPGNVCRPHRQKGSRCYRKPGYISTSGRLGVGTTQGAIGRHIRGPPVLPESPCGATGHGD